VDAVSAVPGDCGGATDFVTGTLEPCLPLLLANLTGAPAAPADATACCAGGAGAGSDIVSAMIDALDSAGGRAECVCPLGAAARALSQSPRLVLALRTVDETCSPGNPPPIFAAFSVSGVFNIGVTGIFAPLCEFSCALGRPVEAENILETNQPLTNYRPLPKIKFQARSSPR
jgi:hypothetical protein